MSGSLRNSRISLKTTQDEFGQANILGMPLQKSGGDRIEKRDKIYDFTPEIHKALSSTSYNGKTMKNESDILMMNNIIRDLGCTGIGDKSSKRKSFYTKTLPKLVQDIHKKTFDDIKDNFGNLEGQGVKIIIPPNIIDIYTRLEILLGLKLSGHTDTVTEATALIDQLYKLGEIQNKQQYRNAINKFSTP